MKKSVIAAGCIAGLFLLNGCATSKKVQVVQPGDNRMSCGQIHNEINKLNQAQKNVDSKKGVTGVNVAAFLFWRPGLAYTYYDAGQATEAIDSRRSHLTNLSNNKNCGR